ncbi:MAG: hypothetical protein EBU93_06570, partial [Chlamydiae bacterium]|nr:hypothetical protein [Chlamydiota bacterium]
IFIQNFLNSTIQVKSPHELKELLQKSIEVSNCEEPKEIYSMNPLLSLEENATLERLISKVFQMLSSSQIQGSILHQSCGFFVDKIVSQFKAKGHEATLKQYSKLINEDTLFTGLSKVISGLQKGGLHNVGETTASNPVDPKVIDQENECFDQLLHQNINIMYHLNVVSAPQKASNIFARFCHKAFDTVSSLSGNGDTEKFASTYISEKVKDLKGTLLNKRAIPVAIYSALLNTV